MGAGVERNPPAMRSPVSWAVLGLLVELPSYGYELVQRFEPTYGDTLELSTASQIYAALNALERLGLIEQMPATGTEGEERRQPKLHYRVTGEGVCGYEDWLVAQAHEERRRSWLLTRQLTRLAPQAALAVIDRLEEAYKEERMRRPVDTTDDPFL